MELTDLRGRIDEIDTELAQLFKQRMDIARQVAEQKAKTGKQVLALLQDTCRSTGRTVIVITHNSALTAMADRVIRIKSGQAISNVVNEHPTPVEEIEW